MEPKTPELFEGLSCLRPSNGCKVRPKGLGMEALSLEGSAFTSYMQVGAKRPFLFCAFGVTWSGYVAIKAQGSDLWFMQKRGLHNWNWFFGQLYDDDIRRDSEGQVQVATPSPIPKTPKPSVFGRFHSLRSEALEPIGKTSATNFLPPHDFGYSRKLLLSLTWGFKASVDTYNLCKASERFGSLGVWPESL